MRLPLCARKTSQSTVILALIVCPIRLRADITVTQITQGGIAPGEVWTRKLRIKGLKMRVESVSGKESYITIYDLETGKRIRLNPQRREAHVIDLKPLSELHLKFQAKPIKLARVIHATGKKRDLRGASCEEYTFDLQVSTLPWAGVTPVIPILQDTGTVCVSQNIPGGVEFTNFVHEAKKRGFTAAASACGPIFSSIGFYFYGDEPNVMVLLARTESDIGVVPVGIHSRVQSTMSVTEINSEAIPDEGFRVPVDWTVKKDTLLPQ